MKKHTERKGERLKVTGIQYTPGPDADDRVSRALGILLRSATKNAATSEEGVNAKKKKPPCRAPEGDALTGGGEEGDSHEPA